MTASYVDWSKIPKTKRGWGGKVNFVFVDTYGTCYMQVDKPVINKSGDDIDGHVPVWIVPKKAIIGPLPPWNESIIERPI